MASEIALLAAVSEYGSSAKLVSEVVRENEAVELDPHLVPSLVLCLAAANPLFHRIQHEHGLVTTAALSHRSVLLGRIQAGDTITTESELIAVRPSSSKPGNYVMTIRDVGRNQRGEQVATIERVVLARHDGSPTSLEGNPG